MRKAYTHMTRSMLCMSLMLLLIAGIALVGVSAQGTDISVNPPEYTAPEVGHSFTVDLDVTNVSNLAGVGAYVWYNTTILDAVECTAHPDAANLAPIDPITFEWIPINDTLGRILFGYTFWPPKSGNLTLLTINFTATAEGTTDLSINGTSLVNAVAEEIPHGVTDGSVNVIPEFPTAIIIPLLLIATLVSAFLGKKVWPRKRKHVLVTE